MRKGPISLIIIAALIIAGTGWWYAHTGQPAIPADAGPAYSGATSTPEGTSATTPTQPHDTGDDTAIAPPPAAASGSGTAPQQEMRFEGIPVTFRAGSTTYEARITDGADVFELMEQLRKTDEFVFTSQDHPGMGQFITSIDGKQNKGRYYWFLYVNGVSSPSGASATTLHARDVIEWRYEKSY